MLDSLDDSLVEVRPRSFPLATARSRVASPRRNPPLPSRRVPWALGSGIMSLVAVAMLCLYVHPPTVPDGAHGDHAHAVASSAFDDPTIESLQGSAEASVGVRRAGKHRGGESALQLGDTLVIETVADRPLELRVYGDTGEPLARCTESRGCRIEQRGARRKYHLELKLDAPGAVVTVAYGGAVMPESFVSLDSDTEAADRAGIRATEISVVHVE
ncbi:MAG TPA: hypothetical protein VLM79_00170 [Kofleriaceae bacterium]|nr:hypothetical protein [Kofleriaceae bacterium]